MKPVTETMPKNPIQVNTDKICLRFDEAGGPAKIYVAAGLSEKSIQRIKKGDRTALTTAHLLAATLRTPVEDLLLTVERGGL